MEPSHFGITILEFVLFAEEKAKLIATNARAEAGSMLSATNESAILGSTVFHHLSVQQLLCARIVFIYVLSPVI